MPPVIRLEKSISHRTRPTRYARAQPGEGRRSTAVPLAVLLLALAQWIGPGVATSGAEVSRDYRDYLLVTESAVHIQNGVRVEGHVGVHSIRGKAKVGLDSSIADGYAIVAAKVKVSGSARVWDVYSPNLRYKPAQTALAGTVSTQLPPGVFETEPLFEPNPFDPGNYPPDFPVVCGGTSVHVLGGEEVELPPGSYDRITIAAGGRAIVGGGTYDVCQVINSGRLEFTQPGTLNIRDRFTLYGMASLVPASMALTSRDVTINYEGRKKWSIGRGATLSAMVFAPNSTLKIGDRAMVSGQIIARNVACSRYFVFTSTDEPEACGDGTLDLGETCDPPQAPQPPTNALCRSSCTFCGDGIVQAGEECDDGNGDPFDGCSNGCKLNPPTLCGDGTLDVHETCDTPGMTAPSGDSLCRSNCTFCGDGVLDTKSGEQCDDGDADDGNFCRNDCMLQPPASCGDGLMQAGETCDPPGSLLPPNDNLCRNDCTFCGDGNTDPGEECDDGNDIDGDSCRNNCQTGIVQECGNGVINAPETCEGPGSDPGSPGGHLCRTNCTYCGDGVVQAGESCDDGNADPNDTCDLDCQLNQPPACGNGVIDGDETCDPPGLASGYPNGMLCRPTCTCCGDGIVNDGEQCDDGNGIADDECNNNCLINPPAICGDGLLNVEGETCDAPGSDPGVPGGGLCRADCTYCGDNVIDPGEECDDGNDIDGDACKNNCTLPDPDACTIDVEKSASQPFVYTDDPAPHCVGDLTALSFRYTGQGCNDTTNGQSGKVFCFGDAAETEPVRIVVNDRKNANIIYGEAADLRIGLAVDATAVDGGFSTFKPNGRIQVFDDSDSLLEEIWLRLACDRRIDLGDRFGSLEVVSVTTSENGEQVLGADVTYSFAVTNTGMSTLTDISVIDDHLGPIPGSPIGSLAAGETATLTQTAFVNETTTNTVTATGTSAGSETCSDRDEITVERVDPPVDPATCDQNVAVAAVTFRYTGQGCLCSTNDQGGRSYCSGNAAFQQPVRIRVENDNGAGVYADVDGVLLEQTVRAAASNANQQTLRAQIRALIYNDGGSLLEELSIHTSCSEPLDIGDQFGSLRVVNLEVR